MPLEVLILAAGNGKRMGCSLPKVLHSLGGVPLLRRVINTAISLSPDHIYVVYGDGGNSVQAACEDLPVTWIKQDKQLGTGHAALQAIPYCSKEATILVLYGDVPLITQHTLRQLLDVTPQQGLGIVVTERDNPHGFGRIIRTQLGSIASIVEEKDATEAERRIKEINTGIMVSPSALLHIFLPQLKNTTNKQHEYHLTDLVALAVSHGHPVGGIMAHQPAEVQGVNDHWQLAQLERYLQYTLAEELAQAGTTLADPHRLDIRGTVTTGKDLYLDANVILEGTVRIGSNCHIGSDVIIRNSTLADHVTVLPHSIIEDSVLKEGARVGPFAHLRTGTTVGTSATIGNFVETKDTVLGSHSKAKHLAYLGNGRVGQRVNIGAGTVLCNYDGAKKWATTIADEAFVGANVTLVAPMEVGEKATIAAGSCVSKFAPKNQLTIARTRQQVVENWERPSKETTEAIKTTEEES